MSKPEKIDTPIEYTNIASALAAAQAEMGRAVKKTPNDHFKKKYADLSSVMDACLPALNTHGIAVVQPTIDDEGGRYVETVLIHGATGQELRCRVPLILQRNDMQGYGSAVTYARRYGLMGMAGIAPDDDDGNAAVNGPIDNSKSPNLSSRSNTQDARPKFDPRAAAEVLITRIKQAKDLNALADYYKSQSDVLRDIRDASGEIYSEVCAAKDARKAELTPPPSVKIVGIDDKIPY